MSTTPYQIITERIVNLLEQGTVPWRRPWNCAPQNLLTGREYRGVNPFILACQGYSSPFWLTYRQARKLGGNVRRGQVSTPVVFWKIYEKKVAPGEKSGAGEAETRTLPVLRYYPVFNLEQCENIPEAEIPVLERRDFVPLELAERIVNDMPSPPEIRHGALEASYEIVPDRVRMPDPQYFESAEAYYSVLFHELTHSTGHVKRLNRLKDSPARFGSSDYSREELVAEMGAAFLCARSGIEASTLYDSAAYIASWLKVLKDDARMVVTAAARAQKAADYILGRSAPEGGTGPQSSTG